MTNNKILEINGRRHTWIFSLLIVCGIVVGVTGYAQTHTNRIQFAKNAGDNTRKENPVIPGDFADPSVIMKDNIYYATGTSSEWAPHFPLFRSTDLFNWKQIGFVLSKTPEWAAASFWAPELFYRNGTYFVYYVARKKSDGISCIGVATSKDPATGFTDRGIVLEFGKEAIDPFIVEDNGQLYITWKAYGLDQRPIEILGSRLSGDGLKTEGESFMLLRDDKKEGLEGQCLVRRNGNYYLFYSPGACCGGRCSYKLEVARSETLQGPYVRSAENPLLSETKEWKCSGHGTLVTSAEGKDFFLYHAYSKFADVYTGRQGMLGQIIWNKETGWPGIQPLGDKASPVKNFRDEFNSGSLPPDWQWDFRHAQPKAKIEKGSLHLSGEANADNLTGIALTVRPLTGNYEMVTEIANHNGTLTGLVLYGDAGQSVGIGVNDGRIEVWDVKKNQRSLLKQERLATRQKIQLKMAVVNGSQCRFYYSKDGKQWNQITTANEFYNGDFLPPWDRSPRPGLFVKGTEPGMFTYFEIEYR